MSLLQIADVARNVLGVFLQMLTAAELCIIRKCAEAVSGRNASEDDRCVCRALNRLQHLQEAHENDIVSALAIFQEPGLLDSLLFLVETALSEKALTVLGNLTFHNDSSVVRSLVHQKRLIQVLAKYAKSRKSPEAYRDVAWILSNVAGDETSRAQAHVLSTQILHSMPMSEALAADGASVHLADMLYNLVRYNQETPDIASIVFRKSAEILAAERLSCTASSDAKQDRAKCEERSIGTMLLLAQKSSAIQDRLAKDEAESAAVLPVVAKVVNRILVLVLSASSPTSTATVTNESTLAAASFPRVSDLESILAIISTLSPTDSTKLAVDVSEMLLRVIAAFRIRRQPIPDCTARKLYLFVSNLAVENHQMRVKLWLPRRAGCLMRMVCETALSPSTPPAIRLECQHTLFNVISNCENAEQFFQAHGSDCLRALKLSVAASLAHVAAAGFSAGSKGRSRLHQRVPVCVSGCTLLADAVAYITQHKLLLEAPGVSISAGPVTVRVRKI